MLFITCNTSESSKPVFEEKVNLEEDSLIETTLILDSISTDQDSLINFEKDSVRNAYENDLSLEIKEIEEEKIDPISEALHAFFRRLCSCYSSFF